MRRMSRQRNGPPCLGRGPEAGGPSLRFSSTAGARLAIFLQRGGHYVSKRARGPDVLLCPVHSMAVRPVDGRACTRPVVMPGTGLLKYFYNMPDFVIDTRLDAITSTGFCPGRFGFFENFVLMFCRDGYDGRSDARRHNLGARRAVRPDGPRAQRAPPRSGGRASPLGRGRAGAARRARGAAKKRAGRRRGGAT